MKPTSSDCAGPIVPDSSKPYVSPFTGEVLEGGDQLTLTEDDERALDASSAQVRAERAAQLQNVEATGHDGEASG